MKEEKTAKIKQANATLKKKKTYTVFGVMYMRDKPFPVDIKTARYLKNTGLFKIEKMK